MINAASATVNMRPGPARAARFAGSVPYLRPRIMRASATDVRELMSPANV